MELGFHGGAAEVSVLLIYDAALLGDECPTFRNGVVICTVMEVQ